MKDNPGWTEQLDAFARPQATAASSCFAVTRKYLANPRDYDFEHQLTVLSCLSTQPRCYVAKKKRDEILFTDSKCLFRLCARPAEYSRCSVLVPLRNCIKNSDLYEIS